MPNRTPNKTGPTQRQGEFLSFLRAFTDRWSIPPSFEEIARHFKISVPSVNNMIKTLESRGFITRVPGAARTIRVIVPEEPRPAAEPVPGSPRSSEAEVNMAVRMASLSIERLVPALKGADRELLWKALEAVSSALEAVCLAAGASEDQRRDAQATIRRVALIAQGMSPETRPGRKLPWYWHQPL